MNLEINRLLFEAPEVTKIVVQNEKTTAIANEAVTKTAVNTVKTTAKVTPTVIVNEIGRNLVRAPVTVNVIGTAGGVVIPIVNEI